MVFRMPAIAISLLALLIQAQAAKPPAFFKTPLTVAGDGQQAGGRQHQRRHVRHRSAARCGPESRRLLHEARERGRLQRDDLPSRDQVRHHPGRRSAVEGSGEGEAIRHGRPRRAQGGARARRRRRAARSSAVLQPGKPDSAGAQFFVCVTDQAALDGKYTVFGRVSEGMDVVQKISEAPCGRRRCDARRTHRDCDGRRFATRRRPSRCRSRRTLPPTSRSIARCSRRPPGRSRSSSSATRRPSTSATSCGSRRRASTTAPSFHRVVKGFAIQTGAMTSRGPLTEKQQKLVHNLQPEFNDTQHVKGIVSMARGDDPASATTSFFIVTGDGELARRQVHGVRPGRRRHGGRRSDRADAGQRRDAGQRDRAQGRKDPEVAQVSALCAERFGETRRSPGGGGQTAFALSIPVRRAP